jgi:hypothetical protein
VGAAVTPGPRRGQPAGQLAADRVGQIARQRHSFGSLPLADDQSRQTRCPAGSSQRPGRTRAPRFGSTCRFLTRTGKNCLPPWPAARPPTAGPPGAGRGRRRIRVSGEQRCQGVKGVTNPPVTPSARVRPARRFAGDRLAGGNAGATKSLTEQRRPPIREGRVSAPESCDAGGKLHDRRRVMRSARNSG